MRVLILAVLALLCVACSAEVLYNRQGAPKGWTAAHRAGAGEKISFTIALKQRNVAILENLFWEVSNPKSSQYQQYLSREEILDIVRPKAEDHEVVLGWLASHGINSKEIIDYGDALDVKTSVKTAEKMFNTVFHYFTHEDGRHCVKQMGEYSVPSEIFSRIDMISGISSFPVPHYHVHPTFPRHVNASNDADGIIAQSIYQFYQLPTNQKAGSAPQTSQGVIEFQGQNFAPADLVSFAQQIGLPIQAVPSANIVGPNDPTNPQTESTLDIDMVASVNLEATNWFWLEDGQGWLYQFTTHFFATENVPQVNSISYGWYEADQCTIAPDECQALGVDSIGYTTRVNSEFQKIALRGISILVSSGDSGANGRTDPDCSIPQLRPAFPASSPYVTAVGATQFNNAQHSLPTPLPPVCTGQGYACVSGGTEVAVSYAVAGFASGGGFSNIAAQPSYQKTAVAAYLNSGVSLPPASYFNKTGRGFPDVAAAGTAILMDQSGGIESVGGTSASSPIFASIVALLNQAMIEKSGKPLGFLNQFLYQMAAEHPAAFHDITSGDNKCTEDGCASTCQGFLATQGWDPVTGLGSPNYQEMLNYINNQM